MAYPTRTSPYDWTLPGQRTRPAGPRPSWEADFDLVSGTLAGDPQAHERFVGRMRCIPRFLLVLMRRCRNAPEHCDLAELSQEAFTRIWENRSAFEGRSSLESWAYSFCTFTLLNAGRPQRLDFREELDPGLRVDSEEELLNEDRHLIQLAVQELNPRLSRVIEMRHYRDLSFPQISRRLCIPVSTAKTRYYRALDHLRIALRPGFYGSLEAASEG